MTTVASWLPPSLRVIVRRPGLSVTRLLTVTVVVAALASVSALASASLFRQMPFPHPERLVQISLFPPDATDTSAATALFPVVFDVIDARGPSFEAIAGIWTSERSLAGRSEPESLSGGRVTANFFSVLGNELALGRTFTADEVNADAPVVVIGYQLSQRLFGDNGAALGATLQIDRRAYTVVGVTGAAFEPVFTGTQFWTPLRWADSATVRATVVLTIGRLRPGASLASANADLDPVMAAARQKAPDLLRTSVLAARDLRETRFGSQRNALIMLALIVLALGLVATANLASLTLSDLSSRYGDIALRSALGSSTRAIVRDELVPCLVLAVVGSALGQWMAAIAAPWMVSLDPALARAGLAVDQDWRVVLTSAIGALLVMGTSVAIPAWRIARTDLVNALANGRISGPRTRRLQSGLVVAQAAIAVVLLSAAVLVVTGLQRQATVDPGFDARKVVTGQLRLSETAFPTHAARSHFIKSVLDSLASTPGLVSAGTTLNPFIAGSSFTTNVTVEDAPRPDGRPYDLQFRRVSPGYFETMRIQLVEGRTFGATDTEDRPPVAVISASFAKRFWPDGSAIGRRIRRGPATAAWLEIVGVVGDVRDAGLERETGPVIYTCYHQSSAAATAAALVVRTAGDPGPAVSAIKRAIWQIDPAQPLAHIVVLDDYLASSLGPQQFRAYMVAWCGLAGMLLTVIGVYGVASRLVTDRTRELGIRVALGASRAHVWTQLLGTSVSTIGLGVVLGSLLSLATDTTLVRLLPELDSSAWLVRLSAIAIVLVVGTGAAIVAVRGAVALDPQRALRGSR